MASSLYAGVSGLLVHQQMLDVVGNNLANVNTTGFKSQRARFEDLVYQTLRPAGGTVQGTVGGTNPVQVGLGVGTAAIDTNLQQGGLTSTGNNLDLAIEGNGFFVVNDGTRDMYTRAGAFGVDKDNNLVDPSTGFRVQRFGTVGEGDALSPAFQSPTESAIKIPFGTTIPGQVTSTVGFQGNLSTAATGPLAESLMTGQAFIAGGTAATAATLFNNLDDNSVDYQAGDLLNISGTDADGTVVNTTLALGPTTTLGDLLTAINAAYSGATATLDANGNVLLTADATGPAQLNLALTDDAGNVGATNFANHTIVATVEGKDGDTVRTAIQIFDIQGTAHTLSLTFQKQGNNLWDLTATIPGGEGTMLDNLVSGVQFNDDGSFRQVSGTGAGDVNLELLITGLGQPQTIKLSFGTANGFDGVTQVGGVSSAAAASQDGYSPGNLSDVSIKPDGIIEGIFTNGRILPLAQLAIATFTNPGGLSREGNNYFSLTTNSGIPLVGTALSGGRGPARGGTLESSNVDVALEFTRLIIAQRGFQVNARTITASDEVLQELANIIR